MQWVTTTQVLQELKESNDTFAWTVFRDHFFSVVTGFAGNLGLSRTDAEDAAQETMLAFIEAFRDGKYNRGKGHLSHWLFGVARRVILDYRKRRPRESLIGDNTAGASFWDMVADEDTVRHTWDMQWENMVLERCLQQARRQLDEKVFRAFELYAILQRPVDEVCEALSISRNAVYISKSRVLSKLRQLKLNFEGLDGESIL